MIQITWLGHATFEIQVESGEVLLLDPWVEGNPAYPEKHKIQKADAIAVSHGHGDHMASVLPLAKKFGSKVFSIVEIAGWLGSKGVEKHGRVQQGRHGGSGVRQAHHDPRAAYFLY